MPQEIKIAMLGARGVGKTSFLTAMYEQFESTIGQTNLQLTPDLKSAAILQERLGELKGLTDNFLPTGGVQSTEAPRSFIFDLGKKGTKPSLRLHFQDFPGEYINSEATDNDREFVKNLLVESDAVLVAIDAPALMERNGKYHEKYNRTQQITNLFQSVYQDLRSPKLVILAPIRCEKYLQNPTSTSDLLKSVKDNYANLFNLFNSEALLPWVVSVVTPIQTVGTVVFSHLEEVANNNPHFYFHKTSPNAEYGPKDSEQPLRYLLRFALKLQIENRNWNWGPYSLVRLWLGWDNYLMEAVRQSAKGCKLSGGFTVLQGEKWLNVG